MISLFPSPSCVGNPLIVAQIKMTDRPTPDVVRLEGERVQQHAPVATVDIVACLRIQGNPRARLELEIRIQISERLLVCPATQSPVQRQFPLQKIFDLSVALGLK